MEERKLEDKLVVVADGSGQIVSAMWPGAQSADGPTAGGMRVEEGQAVHELDLPEELYEAARPDLSGYRVKTRDRGASLVRIDRDD